MLLFRGEPFISKGRNGGSWIKLNLEPIINLHLIPPWRRRLIFIVEDGLEPIIKDGVKLWGDVACGEVPDKVDGFRVDRGMANKLGPAGAGAPLGQLVSILKGGIKHINWATPDMGVADGEIIILGPGEELHWGLPMGNLRSVVVEVCSIVDGKWPQVRLVLVGPVDVGVNHHGAGFGDNNLDGVFSDAILPLGTDAGEPDLLMIVMNLP